nr:hypothetical protein [uncultured Haemophilus sp.]
MLGNLFKIATLGIAGYGIKKLYEVYQNERERRANAPVYSPVEPIKMQEEEREQQDEEEPEDKTIDPMMQFIYDAKPNSYSNENFYQTLKRRLPKETKHWNDEQKNEFIQKMLSKIEGMDGWYFIRAEHHFNIFELANAGSTVLDCFRADTFQNIEQSERVYKIIKQVEYVKERQRNPIYTIKMPNIGFKDVGFELAVINQLMYQDNLLTPKFNMEEFANESKRLIDIDAGANWAATLYLLNIDIPKNMLDNMQTLEISSFALYKNIYFPTPTDMLIRQDYRPGCYCAD